MGKCTDPLTPEPLSPKGARGELILLPSPPLGERVARRGVLISRGETGEGVSPIVNLRWDTILKG
jgi:hypothetical protein